MDAIKGMLVAINDTIIDPLLALMFAGGALFFLYGVARYIWGSESSEARSTGQKHMIWGIVGMVVMVGVWVILRIIVSTFGIDPAVIGY